MSYKSLWLIFCQLVTFTVGLLFVLSTLRPFWFQSVIDKLELGNSEKVHLKFSNRSITQEKGKDENPNYKFGFSEAAIAAHSCYNKIFPNKSLHFEYSTSKGIKKI